MKTTAPYTINYKLHKSSELKSIIELVVSFGKFEIGSSEENRKWIELHKELYEMEGRKIPKSYKPVVVSTQISLLTKDWKDKKAIGVDSDEINRRLELIRQSVTSLCDGLIEAGQPLTTDLLRSGIKNHIISKSRKADTQPVKVNIKTVIDPNHIDVPTLLTGDYGYIKAMISRWSKTARAQTKDTLKTYIKFENWLIKYEQKHKPFRFDLKTMHTKDIEKFINWFGEQRKEDGSPYRLSYVHFFKKSFKYFVKEAQVEDELEVNVNLEKKIFNKISDEGIKEVYLTFEQLSMIKKTKYDKNDSDIKSKSITEQMFTWCKDLAIVSASCGYRWSDLQSLSDETFNYDKKKQQYFFHLDNSVKTDNHAKIPCFDLDVVKIFEKYDSSFPVLMEEQTFNETIKIVCKLAGIKNNKTFIHKHAETLKQIKDTKPMYKWISHRSFRRTMASNLIREYHIPLPVAMSFTSHKTEKVFKGYICLTPQEYYELGVEQMKQQKEKIKSKMKVV